MNAEIITQAALVKRINRQLAKRGQSLQRNRSAAMKATMGEFILVTGRNMATWLPVNLEELGRELGVLAANENDGPLTIKAAHFHEALRIAAEAGATKAHEEAQRAVSGLLGSLMGSTMALEGIADAADTLLQQNPEEGGFMLAELVTSVRLRLEAATAEMESASKGWGAL